MLFAPLAIRSGSMGVSRARRLQHRRGRQPATSIVRSPPEAPRLRVRSGEQGLLASIEDGVIEAVTRDGDKQLRGEGCTGNTP
jgi:hypothetical protein